MSASAEAAAAAVVAVVRDLAPARGHCAQTQLHAALVAAAAAEATAAVAAEAAAVLQGGVGGCA